MKKKACDINLSGRTAKFSATRGILSNNQTLGDVNDSMISTGSVLFQFCNVLPKILQWLYLSSVLYYLQMYKAALDWKEDATCS